ncbi:MAG: CHASE2 domain-containing protein [Hyphomicrobiaceae bacterium]
MKRWSPWHWLLAAAVAAAISAIGLTLAARELLFVDTLDKYLGDLRTAWLAPRAETQRTDLAIVMIGEEALRDYPSVSPIDRRLLARVVDEVAAAGPKVIGLDVYFERRMPFTADLVASIRRAKVPVVLGALDDRYLDDRNAGSRLELEGLAVQEDLLAEIGRPAGHLWLERKVGTLTPGNATIRFVGGPNPRQRTGVARESFAAVVAKTAGYQHEPPNRVIAWQKPPRDAGTPLVPQIEIRRHKPETLATPSGRLLSDAERGLLRNRVVLIGASLRDRDQHPTPLSVLDGSVHPGVLLHAQVIGQRIDGNRDVRTLPGWVEFLIVAGVAFLCILWGHSLQVFHRKQIYQLAGLAVIGVFGLALFRFWHIDSPSGALAFAWLAGAFIGHHANGILLRLGLFTAATARPT